MEELTREILLLRHELHQLRIKNEEQEKRIIRLVEENMTLRLENEKLQEKLTTLEDKLSVNSSNSGLPTSKDDYRIERKAKPSSGRKPGGQPGHK